MPRTIVITGASSGLGRATAIAFARDGHRIALAARRLADLEETARLCRDAGGEAIVVQTDVTDRAQIDRLVETVLTSYGQVDVWINNAGTTMFGLFDETPFAEHRQVLETNLIGPMACAHAILPHFRARKRGVLINIGSVLSEIGQPFVPAYVISKFGLRGLSEALRSQVADDLDIHVCTFLPYTIDTPHFQSGANHVGKRARATPPIQSPEALARELVLLAAHPRRQVRLPRAAVFGLAFRWAFPRLTERLVRRALTRWHFDETPQPITSGNLHHPVEIGEGAIHGARRPQLRAPRFVLWVAREMGRIALESVARGLRALTGHRPRTTPMALLPAGKTWPGP